MLHRLVLCVTCLDTRQRSRLLSFASADDASDWITDHQDQFPEHRRYLYLQRREQLELELADGTGRRPNVTDV